MNQTSTDGGTTSKSLDAWSDSSLKQTDLRKSSADHSTDTHFMNYDFKRQGFNWHFQQEDNWLSQAEHFEMNFFSIRKALL